MDRVSERKRVIKSMTEKCTHLLDNKQVDEQNLKSEVLSNVPGIVFGFGTLAEPVPECVQPFWDRNSPQWKQVHGIASACINVSRQQCGDIDASYTRSQEIPIGVKTADCVPILMSHQSGKTVAAIHAGWKGTRARILRNLWDKLKTAGENPGEWVASIGPSIGPCCYEVSEELSQDFKTEFGTKTVFGRILDLPGINALELKEIGLPQVEIIRKCTRCSSFPLFHSHRREPQVLLRQFSVIMISSSHGNSNSN
jgi:YfiH family protein